VFRQQTLKGERQVEHLYEKVERIRSASEHIACVFRPLKQELTDTGKKVFDALHEVLSRVMRVEFVDEDFLFSFESLFKSHVDILVIPKLEGVPEQAYRNLKKYLAQGGAIVLSAEDLFLAQIEDSYLPIFETRKHYPDEYFRRTASYLGLKPYVSQVSPQSAVVDTDFLPQMEPRLAAALPPRGVYCATGSDVLHSEPPFGHVFPERYPVSRNYVVVAGVDISGEHLTSSAVFCQNWENGSRIVAVASNEKGGLLDPGMKWFAPFVTGAARFCGSRAMIEFLQPEYACYRRGEPVTVRYSVRNFSDHAVDCELDLEIATAKEALPPTARTVHIPAGERQTGTFERLPVSRSDDVHTLRLRLRANEGVQSRAENAFVIWDENIAAQGPTISASGKYFSFNGKPALIAGTNYYESQIGELMWLRPNVERLDRDLSRMADCGMRYVRIHYHHPKWFHDYFRYMHDTLPDYFEQEHGPLPDEPMLRIFDAHVYLCQKYGIVYGGDLFTLLPEELGDPRGWYGVHDYASFPEKFQWQRRFLELLVPRYLNVPGIAWDLYNEPKGVDEQVFRTWAGEIRKVIREMGDTHPITVGTENPARFDSVVDFYAEHRNFSMAGKLRADTPKPEMLQEVWLDRPPTRDGDSAQREDMRQALLAAFGSGQGGFSPWQWTNQARLWSDYRTYIGEVWDDRLGCCTRDDGTLKPAGGFYRDFAHIVSDIPITEYDGTRFRVGAGFLEFHPPGQVPPRHGEILIAYHHDGKLLRGLACGRIEWNGQTFLESEGNADIWFSAAEPEGISRKGTLAFKVSRPGTITLPRDSVPARAAVRATVHSGHDLASITTVQRDGLAILRLEPWHCDFWIHLDAPRGGIQ